MTTAQELKRLLADRPETEIIELVIADMAGCLRGKRLPPSEFETVFETGFSIPASLVLLDTSGRASDAIPYGTLDGDPDAYARIVEGTLSPISWAPRPSAQALFSLFDRDGTPYFGDSRHVLSRVAERLRRRGLKIVMALELEFHLLDANCEEPTPRLPDIKGTNQKQGGNQTYHPDDLWQVDGFLSELTRCCETQHIPVSTAIAEYGAAQFEINLHHLDDPLQACDHAVLLKRAAKAVALKHGMVACFMAKPFESEPGNGLHIHVSLVDEDGKNFFSRGEQALSEPPFSPELNYAVGGLAASMADCMAVFAPNANSYRRLRTDFYAPVMANWGINHREVSLRIPLSGPENTRIEHRTAGADANPYLVAAAVLMGIDAGLEARTSPPPLVPEGSETKLEVNLPIRWSEALNRFGRSELVADYFGEKFCEVYEAVRRSEEQRFHNEISDRDFQWYLRQV